MCSFEVMELISKQRWTIFLVFFFIALIWLWDIITYHDYFCLLLGELRFQPYIACLHISVPTYTGDYQSILSLIRENQRICTMIGVIYQYRNERSLVHLSRQAAYKRSFKQNKKGHKKKEFLLSFSFFNWKLLRKYIT